MATLTIGPGKQYTTFNAAYAAAVNGDILVFDAGVYFNVWLTLTKTLTYRGPTGGWATMDQTGWAPNGKAHVINQGNSTFEWWEFRNSVGGNGNEAGIRYETGVLTLNNCWFHDNYNGILGGQAVGPEGTGSIIMTNCEFEHNGKAGAGNTHNFYTGDPSIGQVTANNCYFHETVDANEFKSRAYNNSLTNCRFFNLNDTASWEVDFPDGGNCTVTNCVIQQGVNGGNPSMTNLAAEVGLPNVVANPVQSINFQGCTIVNDKSTGTLFYNPNNYSATWNNTSIWKAGSLTLPAGMTNTTNLSTRPTLDTSHPWGATGPVTISAAGASSGVSSVSAISVIVPPASTAYFRTDSQVQPNQTSSVTAYRSDDQVVPLAATGSTAFRSISTLTPIQSRVNSVFNKPTGVVAGDTLIILMSLGNPTGLPTVTPPAGFTAVTTLPAGTAINGSDPYRAALYAWYKVAGSSEPTTYTVTHASSDTEGVMYSIQGGSTTVAPHAAVTTGTNSVVTTGSVTMTNANGFLIEGVFCWDNAAGTPPTGFTERYDNAGAFYCADEFLSGSGLTSTFTSTHASNVGGVPWSAILIGVEPAPASSNTRVNTTFNKPAGVVAGDTLVLLLFTQALTALPTFTPPTGFLPIGQQPAAIHTDGTGLVGAMWAWYKIASGSEPSTYTVTHTAATTEGDLLSISGGNGQVPGRVTTAGTGTSIVSGTVPTFVNPNGHMIEFVYCWVDATGTPPTSFTERYDPAGVHNVYVSTRVFPSSGQPGTVTSTHPNNGVGADTRWGCQIFTIEPVSTGTSLRTNTTFNKPVGVATGDTLVAVMYASAQTALPTITPPTGFANIGATNPVTTDTDGSNLVSGIYAWYKIAGSAEPATYQFTHTSANTEGDMYCIGGGDGQVPKIITNSGTGTTVTTGSLNLTNPNAFLIDAVYCHDDATGTPPANFTERYDP